MVKKIIVFVKSLLIKIILLIKVTLAIVHIIILDINLFVNMTYMSIVKTLQEKLIKYKRSTLFREFMNSKIL